MRSSLPNSTQTGPAQLGRIEIRGLRIRGRHGWFDQEQAVEQLFEVDADISYDAGPAAESDDLADSVDYSVAVERLVGVVEGPPVRLLERLAALMLNELQLLPKVEWARVSLRKLDPPIDRNIASVGVTLRSSYQRSVLETEGPEEIA
jgi:dihydroneopterin aldolase